MNWPASADGALASPIAVESGCCRCFPTTKPPMHDMTRILSAIEQGDTQAAEQLLAQEKPGQTLQATAMVHDHHCRRPDSRGATRPDRNPGRAAVIRWQRERVCRFSLTEFATIAALGSPGAAWRAGGFNMAGDWIKVENVTPDKPEIFAIADALGIDPDAVTGKLVRIWIWADQHTTDGNAPTVTRSLLDRITSVRGFTDAMLAAGWLLEVGGKLCFPNFSNHNGQTSKARALTSKRVEASKARGNGSVTPKKRKCNAPTVTEALPEKRRDVKYSLSGAREGRNRSLRRDARVFPYRVCHARDSCPL